MSLLDNTNKVEVSPMVGTEGNDNFSLTGNGTGQDPINLLAGNDILVVSGNNYTVNGDAGNDELTDEGTGTGNTLDGGTGNDTIFGGTGGTLTGGSGRDVIYASPNGGGENSITGGSGRDIFIIATGEIPETNPNTITDFNSSLDFIGLSLAPDVTDENKGQVVILSTVEGITTISVNGDEIAIVNGTVTAENLVILTPDANNNVVLPASVNANTSPSIAPVSNFPAYTTETAPGVGDVVGTFTITDLDQDELTFSITGTGFDGGDPTITTDDKTFTIASVTDPNTGVITITADDANLFTITPTAPSFENDQTTITGSISVAADANTSLFTTTANFTINISATDGIQAATSKTVSIAGNEAEQPSAFNLDIDGSGGDPAIDTDGFLIIRYLARQNIGGLVDASLNGITFPASATRTTVGDLNNPNDLNKYLGDNISELDIDGSGGDPAIDTDGFLIIRYLARQNIGGLVDASLNGITFPASATRTTVGNLNDPNDLNNYLGSLMPSPSV